MTLFRVLWRWICCLSLALILVGQVPQLSATASTLQAPGVDQATVTILDSQPGSILLELAVPDLVAPAVTSASSKV